MKAVAVGPELTLEVRDVPDAEPGEGEVAIARRGVRHLRLRPPHASVRARCAEGSIMGHEFAGVDRRGRRRRRGLERGRRVCVYPFPPLDQLDIAAAMASGIGLGTNDGGYAESAHGPPAEMLWRIPEEVELAHGALVEPLAVGTPRHRRLRGGAGPGLSASSAAARSGR